MSAVRVEGLTVIRGGRAVLDDLTCTVPAGSVTGLVGPSGSGKTTLLRVVVGVQRIGRGRVEVLGEQAGAPGLRARIGYMAQSGAVYGDLTVRENLRFFGRVVGAGPADVQDAIATVALEAFAGRVVSRLSEGQRARVSLGAALLGSPSLLVLDEPTVGLDPVLRRDLWTIFHELAASGTTLIVSSHVMDEADRCATLIVLRDGTLLSAGSPGELRAATATESLELAFLRLVERAR
jgi:ABC-2 type transport system ATP-binding protein